MNKRLHLGIFFSLFTMSSAFGWQLSGKITDPEGIPLPYVRVAVENTTYGVVSNLVGEYFLELNDGDYTIVFSCYEYFQKKELISIQEGNVILNIVLDPVQTELSAVQVFATRHDPAYKIIEKVVENKEKYLDQFVAFKCQTYTKIILEADLIEKKKSGADSIYKDGRVDTTFRKVQDSLLAIQENLETEIKNEKDLPSMGPLGGPGIGAGKPLQKLEFLESIKESWFKQPRQVKEIVIGLRDYTHKEYYGGVQISFNMDDEGLPSEAAQALNPYLFTPGVSQSDFNFYRNAIDYQTLGPQPFVSPISSSGKLFYKYRLEESFYENDRMIHKIEIIPKEFEGPMFEGYVWVIDGLWCLKSVDLKIQPGAMHFFKYFELIHDYSLVDSAWILSREEYYYHLKEGKRNFYGNTINMHRDYELEPEMNPRFFANELLRIEDDAEKKDSAWWQVIRPITLKDEEMRFTYVEDSLESVRTNPDSLAKSDSAYNRIRFWDIVINGLGFRNQVKKREIYFNSLLESIRPFSVGGYRQSIGGNYSKEFEKGYKIAFDGELNFGFKNLDLKGQGRLKYTFIPRHFGKASLSYGNTFDMINNYQSISTMFSRGNYIRRIHYGLGVEYELLNGFYADVDVKWFQNKSLDGFKIEEWSNTIFGSFNDPQPFSPYEEFLVSAKLYFTPFQKYQIVPYKKILLGSDWPTFSLTWKKSIPGIWQSDLDFDYLELSATQQIQLGNLGESRWQAFAGSYVKSDSLLFLDYRFFRRSDPVWFSDPLRSFQLLDTSMATKNEFFEAHYYHNFYGLFFNKIPLIKKLKLEAVAGTGILAIRDADFMHAELFAGIGWPFRIKKQLFKITGYYISSISTFSGLDHTFKIGLNIYDAFHKRWEY